MKTIKIISLLLVTQITGCAYQVTNNIEILKAIQLCGKAENIQEISIHALGGGKVRCADGSSSFLNKIKLIRG